MVGSGPSSSSDSAADFGGLFGFGFGSSSARSELTSKDLRICLGGLGCSSSSCSSSSSSSSPTTSRFSSSSSSPLEEELEEEALSMVEREKPLKVGKYGEAAEGDILCTGDPLISLPKKRKE